MAVELFLRELCAWLVTWTLHSTLLLGAALLFARRFGERFPALAERLLRGALLCSFLTTTVVLVWDIRPLGGRIVLGSPEPAAIEPAAIESVRLAASALPETSLTPLAAPARDAAPLFSLLRAAEPRPRPSALFAPREEPHATPSAPVNVLSTSAAARPWSGWSAWGTWIACLWAAGAIVALAGLARDALALRFHLGLRTQLHAGGLRERLDALVRRAGLRRPVALSVAPRAAAPLSFGLLRAEIALPPRALDELMPEEQDAVLAHELAHIARRDPSWILGARAVECVFFFQPLLGAARRRLEDLSELLCDARAGRWTGRPEELAGALAVIAGWLTLNPRRLPAPAMARSASLLSARIRRLLQPGPVDHEAQPAWCAGAAALAVCAVAGLAPAFPAHALGEAPPAPPRMAGAQPAPAPAVETAVARTSAVEAAESVETPAPSVGASAPCADAMEAPLDGPAEVAADAIAPPAAAPADDATLAGALDLLDEQIDALESELESLRDDLHTRAADAELVDLFQSVEARIQRLSDRRARLRELAADLDSASDAAAPQAPDLTTPDSEDQQ